MREYPANKYTTEQREWCEMYERTTLFEPLMEDYDYGIESFYQAARKSVNWFEDWQNDAMLKISANIPGHMQDFEERINKKATQLSGNLD